MSGEGLPSEDPVEESYVRFEFSLEEQDTKRIGALLQENTPADVLKAPVAVDRAGKGLGLLDLALRLPLPGYWADVMAIEKGAEPRSLPTGHGYKVAPRLGCGSLRGRTEHHREGRRAGHQAPGSGALLATY